MSAAVIRAHSALDARPSYPSKHWHSPVFVLQVPCPEHSTHPCPSWMELSAHSFAEFAKPPSIGMLAHAYPMGHVRKEQSCPVHAHTRCWSVVPLSTTVSTLPP